MSKTKDGGTQCDFCRKLAKQTKFMIGGNGPAFPAICDYCLDVCLDIVNEEKFELTTYNLIPKDIVEVMGIRPIFARPGSEAKTDSCFYLGPFADPFNSIYADHIAPIFTKYGFSITRADEIFSTDVVIEDIWAGISAASIIVADVTGKNPNVLYEVGIAHTVGKPVLMISQSANDIPFDLRHRRCVIYEYTPPGCRKLEEGLSQTIEYLRHGGTKPTSRRMHAARGIPSS